MTEQHPLYGKMQPTNLLIMNEGRKAWDRDVVLYTPGEREIDGKKIKSLDRQETPADKMKVSNPQNQNVKDLPDLQRVIAKLPSNFCPGCGRTGVDLDNKKDAKGGAGLWMMIEDWPGVAKMGDIVCYFKCDPCFEKRYCALAGRRRLVLPNNGWQRYDANAIMNTEQAIIGYIKANRYTHPEIMVER